MSDYYTAEEEQWLRENHDPYKGVRLTQEAYNKRFGKKRSMRAIYGKLNALGSRQINRRKLSDEERDWLKENAVKLSRKETAKLFNEKFGRKCSENSVAVITKRLGVHHPKNCRSGGPPIGSQTIMNGYLYIKVRNELRAGFYKNWEPMHQILWKQHYGELPEDKQIIFLDGDHSNINIDNLYAVSGRISRMMSKNGWYSKDPDITLAGIKWCELYFAERELEHELL